MVRKIIISTIFVLLSTIAFSQNISVSSFRCIENDLSARLAKVKDINSELCALIIVNTPVRGFEFSGCNVEKTEQKTGAIWVFVSPGVKFITIMHRDLGQLRNYPFPESIKSGYVYEMVLQTAKIAEYSFELKELSPEKKEKIAQERITIKETPAPIKEEPKMKHRSKGGFSLNAGFDLGFNVNAGMKATLKTKKMKRLGFIVTADFIYSYPSNSELKEAKNYAQEINNSFGYEVYQITLPKTIDLPIMIGLSLEAISKSKFQLLIEGEAGLNIRKYSNRIDKITFNGETEKRITTYPFSSGIASQVGIVAKFQERLSIGLHAYILGGENQENNSSTRLNPLIKIGYNF